MNKEIQMNGKLNKETNKKYFAMWLSIVIDIKYDLFFKRRK